jgi:hypothetical protein
MQVTVDIPYASPPQGMKYFTIIGPHIDCMDEHYLVRFYIFIHSFIYFHSIDPYMAGTPVAIEIVSDKKTNHSTCIKAS